MTRDDKELVRRMYREGWCPEDIADELGLDECEVIEYCAEILEEQQ